MESPRKFGRLGNFARLLTVAVVLVLCPVTPAWAWGGHKQRVYVQVAPVYTVPTGVVGQAPVAYAPANGYYYPAAGTAAAPIANGYYNAAAPVANGYYFAPMGTAAAPVAMAPGATYVYPNTANAPQGFTYGTGNAPTSFLGNAPVAVSGSRLTSDEARKDVLADLRTYYQQNKSGQSSRTALRKALKDEAKDRYVEAIGSSDVAGPDDLNASENREIDQLVDIVMRDDATSSSGYGYGYGYGSGAQPMYYYYVYPVAPVQNHHHH
jgi:hypothetical protein